MYNYISIQIYRFIEKHFKGKSICIGVCINSGNQAALKSLKGRMKTSMLVLECLHTLNKLGRQNDVHLIWVSGHSSIEGNERANCLADRTAQEAILKGRV